MNLDTVETGLLRTLHGLGVGFYNFRNLAFLQSAVRRRLNPSERCGYSAGWLLPILRSNGCRHGCGASGEGNVRKAPRMPQLSEHKPALGVNGVNNPLPPF